MSDYRARYLRIWVIRTCRGRCSDMWLWNKKESVLFHSLLARNKVRNGINLVFIALWWIMMIRHSERNLNCHIGYGLIKGKQSRTCFRTVFATCLNQDCWFYFSVVLRCWFSLMKSGLGFSCKCSITIDWNMSRCMLGDHKCPIHPQSDTSYDKLGNISKSLTRKVSSHS